MGLAGESGCGKSTLGKSLIRMDTRMQYVSGRVELDGRELPIWDDARDERASGFKEVSIIPQYALSALNPTRRIGDDGDASCSRSRQRRTSTRCCRSSSAGSKLVGLPDDVLDRYPIELSGGMKQRVVMVLSSLLDPSLLIADEVTSALDVSSQRAVAELLVEFRDRGFVKSMIVITHDLVRALPDRRHDPRHVRGQARREGAGRRRSSTRRGTRTRSCCSRRCPEVGVRFAEKRLAGHPRAAAVARSTRRPAAASARAARSRSTSASEEPPFAPIEPGHASACWKAAA